MSKKTKKIENMQEEILKTVRQKMELNFKKEFYSEAEYPSVVKKLRKYIGYCANTYLDWVQSKDQRISEFIVNLKSKEVQALFNEDPEKFNKLVKVKDAGVGQWKFMSFMEFLHKYLKEIITPKIDDKEAEWFTKLINEIPVAIKDAGNYMLKNQKWKDFENKFYDSCMNEFFQPRKQLAALYSNTENCLSFEEFSGSEQVIINTGYPERQYYPPSNTESGSDFVIASNQNTHYIKKLKNISGNFLYLFIISKEKILRLLIDSKGLVERVDNSNFLDLKRILISKELRVDIYYWNTENTDIIVMDSYKDAVRLQNQLNQFRVEARLNYPQK